MNCLLDTNGWILFFEDSALLSPSAAELIESPESSIHVSMVSIWEAAIKVGLGKLKLPYDLENDLPLILSENGFELLPIEYADVVRVEQLERLHGDPFDRLQIIQAKRRGWPIVTRDTIFESYGLKKIW